MAMFFLECAFTGIINSSIAQGFKSRIEGRRIFVCMYLFMDACPTYCRYTEMKVYWMNSPVSPLEYSGKNNRNLVMKTKNKQKNPRKQTNKQKTKEMFCPVLNIAQGKLTWLRKINDIQATRWEAAKQWVSGGNVNTNMESCSTHPTYL